MRLELLSAVLCFVATASGESFHDSFICINGSRGSGLVTWLTASHRYPTTWIFAHDTEHWIVWTRPYLFGCPLGFHLHRRSCYWFSNVKSSFPEAAAYCRYLESHLVVISSADEDSFIRGYAIRRGKAPFYRLGATDLNIEGRWMWEGQRRMRYTHWSPGQPDNAGGAEHCLEIRRDFGNYLWNDFVCDHPSHFICEKEL